ncbi:Bax inhibitor-1 family protein [Lysinibacillus xylanilyticus]|uniref:Bax inhibitor-1/YccA family protein n=1 Tax=Lysinibacillus xylanilyticus TaxID=582475 RepID=UPI002B23F86E|nr:Bax inhibitor-1 family protein [Lysinibacillus xylanilyticus]MEB2280983.1 Bax inhibitor-1 family protein [Lysinibacillus xylanilyticus]
MFVSSYRGYGNQSVPHHDNNTYFLLVESFSMLIRMLLYKSYFTKERIFYMAYAKNQNLNKILKHFAFMWVLTVVGMYIATLLPPAIVMPISIIALVLLIIVIFVRNLKLANSIMYTIPFLMGILLFWTTQFYIVELGQQLVLLVFVATVAIFIVLALIGMMMNKDISNWGSYLFTVLIVVIVFSLAFMFFPVSNLVALIIAGITVLLFSLYTVYDFNRIRHNHVSDAEVVGMALNLYLDFINLFVNLLEVIWRLKNEFD